MTALVRQLLAWYRAQARDLPWRQTTDPYAIWVSEVMLQQTQVRTVLRYWRRWMRALPDLEALARASESRLLRLWEGLGYYSRARRLQAAARLVFERHAGVFPREADELRALPGIGRYTAGAIASIAFDRPAPAVDGNVARVLARLFGLEGRQGSAALNGVLWDRAAALVRMADRRRRGPRDRACAAINQALMELGALVCTPRKPDCGACPVRSCCRAFAEGRTDQLPRRREVPPPEVRRRIAVVIEVCGRVWIRRRAAGGVNAGLWEFPEFELSGQARGAGVVARALGCRSAGVRRLGRIRHSITRYRIELDVVRVDGLRGMVPGDGEGRWAHRAELERLPFTAAHRRIVRLLRSADRGGSRRR
ncbi:MAG TPA: A/G-specific adenine glycosylase [Verrucomicrobiota bacterium]|nr:A/G-specific adenine glycosylase [Verrucomicrobiota bacterium]HNU50234.1 A/G-specific adenine glycosylase [Verrucomicrobiota bacterium]